MAEVKPFKLGEPLTDKADGNPELSLNIEESVETRRKVCIRCQRPIPEWKYSSAIYCSDTCRESYNTMKSRLKYGKAKKIGVGSGGNQFGKDNSQYKDGRTLFRDTAFENLKHICNRCNSKNNLLVHHKDTNRLNNELGNLEILCKKCHQEHHCIKDLITERYIKG